MFIRLLVLFTVIPLLELALLIEVGKRVGVLNTIVVVLLTGVAGAALARSQGFGIIRRIQMELSRNQLPGDSLIEGGLILAGALLLLTPGLITDLFGFSLLLPHSRKLIRVALKHYFRAKIDKNEIQVNYRVDK